MASARRLSVDEVEAQALEAAAGLKSIGAKLVCIDFDATFVTVHTGGLWSESATTLCSHVRRFFLLLVPLLCEANVNVAIVTFSPQVQLIQDVLKLCFDKHVTNQLVIRGDDQTWSLNRDQADTFMSLGGLHLDRKFKLPFMISAALEVQRRSGVHICNRDTVLVDDDVVNIRVANDNGVVGVYFDPEAKDEQSFCERIRRLHSPEQEPLPQPTPLRTPSKKPRSGSGVKLVAKEHKFLSTGRGSGARRRLGVAPGSGNGRTSSFNMCTPSPVMKLKCTVDMGKPRSKRASRILRSYSREMETALPVVSESSTFSVEDVSTTPTKQPASLRQLAETRGLQTSPIVYKM